MDPRLLQAIQLYGYDDIGPAGVRGYVEDALSRNIPVSAIVGALASGGGDPARFQALLASQLEVSAATSDAIARTLAESATKAARQGFADQQRGLSGLVSTPSGATVSGQTPPSQPVKNGTTGSEVAGGLAETLAEGGFVEIPGRPGVYVNADGDILDLNPKVTGGGGYAPQGKTTGVLPNGTPYIIDPNQPPGSQIYNGLTGALLSEADFKQLPTQVTSDWGTLLLVSPDGTVTDTGQKVGFAKLTPQEQQAFEREQAQMRESGANTRQSASDTAANQRAELSARTAGFQTAAGLVPQLGNLALNQSEFAANQTKNPSDFLARAFATRGGTSPLGFVSQADLINQLSQQVAGFNSALSQFGNFNPSINPAVATQPQQGFVAPAVQQPAPQPPTQAAPTDEQRAAALRAAGFTGDLTTALGKSVPGFASGTDPFADLFNPEARAAEIAGTSYDSGDQARIASDIARANALAAAYNSGDIATYQSLGGTAIDTRTTPGYVAPVTTAPIAPLAVNNAPIAPLPVNNTTGFSFQAPQIPRSPTVTQAELQATEKANRPPAIDALLNNQPIPGFRLPFNVPSYMNYQQLTPDEKTAFGTTLATQYNLAPSDVEKAITDRYAAPAGRQAVARFEGGTGLVGPLGPLGPVPYQSGRDETPEEIGARIIREEYAKDNEGVIGWLREHGILGQAIGKRTENRAHVIDMRLAQHGLRFAPRGGIERIDSIEPGGYSMDDGTPVDQGGNAISFSRYESGTPGFMNEPVFLGNEKGAELFLNPTNAPIAVVDANTTKKMGFKAKAK